MFTRRLLEVWQAEFGDAETLAKVLSSDLHPKEDGPAACQAAAERMLARYREMFDSVADGVGQRFPEFAEWRRGDGVRRFEEAARRFRPQTIEELVELAGLLRYALGLLPSAGSEEDAWTWCMASLYTVVPRLPGVDQNAS